MTIKLLIVDDHEVVRLGLRNLLNNGEITVVREAKSSAETIETLADEVPDLVLLDIRMKGGDGLTTLGRIKLEYPDLPVLLLSAYDNPTYVARAVALGASGFVMKDCDRDQLVKAIRICAGGGAAWTREELRRVTGALTTPRISADTEVPLTQRECEVLKQMSFGLTNKEIAKVLDISYETVKEHVQHILKKIGVTDRTQAAVWAVRENLV